MVDLLQGVVGLGVLVVDHSDDSALGLEIALDEAEAGLAERVEEQAHLEDEVQKVDRLRELFALLELHALALCLHACTRD